MIYRDLTDVLFKRGNHVFWHSVATHRSVSLCDDISESLPVSVSLSWVDCSRLPVDGNGDLQVDRLDLSGDVVCLANIDFLLGVRRGSSLLRQLRPPAMGVLDQGKRLLVLANRAQSDFPVIDGSNIVHDGMATYLRPLPDSDLRGYGSLSPFTDAQRAKILQSAKGFRGVVSRIGELARSGEEGRAVVLPNKPEREAVFDEVASDALIELGDAVVGTVLTLLDTVGRTVHCDDLDERCFVRMKSAGLARLDKATDEVLLFPGVSDVQARRIVALADMKTTSSTLWNQVIENVFVIERCVRQLLGRRMIGEHEADFVERHSEEIARNWSQDSGLRATRTGYGPISPLNFVNLTDLLSFVRELSEERHVGSLSSGQWRELADDLVPIRNRVGHMRLPSSMDLQVSRRWRATLTDALQSQSNRTVFG